MPKSLVIVESPAKAKTINKFLGRNYVVRASMGHVRDLPTSKLGVDGEHGFEPDYVVIPKKKKVLSELKSEAKKADHIFLAPDPDREGEAISFHLAEELGGRDSKIQRVLFNEITKKAVEEAIKNPREIDKDKVDAQQARRVLDRLGGDPPRFVEKLSKIDGENAELKDEASAKSVVSELENLPFVVKKITAKERRRRPVPPFITSKLQQEGARKLGFTAKRTMMVAQRLYEGIELGQEGPVGL